MKETNFQETQWISWIGATLVTAFTFTVFAYNEFDTKEHARETKEAVAKQLDAIEYKIDRLSDKVDRLKK